LLPFIIIGLTAGAVYALAGLGLVLTYKTSGVFNFAHGGVAAVAAYVFYALYVLDGWPWPLAAIIAIPMVGTLIGWTLELLARRIQTTGLALRVAATVGLLIVIEAAVVLIYGTETVRNVPVFLGTSNVEVFGTPVQVAQIVTLAFAVVVTCVLTAVFRYSRRGLSMRAVVDNPELLDTAGTSPVATRRVAWILGTWLAASSGVLFAPLLALDPVQLTLLVASAFGAAAIGAFTSLPWTLAGGLGIGVLASLCTKWFTTGLLAGLPPSLPFVVLFVVLLVFPRKRLVGRSFTVPRSRPTWTAPVSLQLSGAVALIVALALVPGFAGIHLTDWTTFVAMSIVFMSLALLVRTSGQVSLCQVSFVAIGAAAFSHLTLGSGIPWLVALVLAGLIAVPIGALLAIPAIRLTGLYLALATFGFGILLQGMFYTQSYMFGAIGLGLNEPRPHLSFLNVASDKGYYYLVLALAVLAGVSVVALTRSRLGRLLRGAADSAVALQTSGTSVNVTRVLVFCISAFLAAVGGALAAVSQTTVSADSYEPLLSLTYFALIMIVGQGAPWNAVLASAAVFLIPSYVSGAQVSTVLQLAFGATAILYAVIPARAQGVPVALQRLIDRTFGRVRLPVRAVRVPALRRPVNAAAHKMQSGLTIEELQVRFGGLVAVDGVSLHAGAGRITGLIGPNGAGKTTIFNACTGLVKPAGGRIMVGEVDLGHLGPAARARRGLGRTFQRMELFDSLTVRENVEAGAEGTLAGANPLSQILAWPGQRARVSARAQQALELCNLRELADVPAMSLSTGQRRLVELARCLAGPFGHLLLDEPSSGLDRNETKRFGEILRRVVSEREVGILLVEHDMSLVLDICEHVYVLDFGELIFAGSPPEIAASPVVKAAYLGDDALQDPGAPGRLTEELA
jgi:ABC-type branched-subunit amino acid transport system ATPase component/branched-subunit amino acid ABC-type transport system permease component